jgi:hypothetical protein
MVVVHHDSPLEVGMGRHMAGGSCEAEDPGDRPCLAEGNNVHCSDLVGQDVG